MFFKNMVQDVVCNDWADLAVVVSENLETQIRGIKKQKRFNKFVLVALIVLAHDIYVGATRSAKTKEKVDLLEKQIDELVEEVSALRGYIESVDDANMKWCQSLSDDITKLKETK